MKYSHVLFLLLLAMCVVIVTAFVIGETPSAEVRSAETGELTVVRQGHGIPHARFNSMLSGGEGTQRHARILWVGWAFGMLQVALYVVLIAFGGQRQGRLGPLGLPLAAGGIVYATAFSGMVYSYRGYMQDANHQMLFSLPVPTAWMIYGVWPAPLLFVLLYMFTFDCWTFRDEDRDRFQAILAEKQKAAGDQP